MSSGDAARMWLVLQAWPERAEGWAIQDLADNEHQAAERIAYQQTRVSWLLPDHRFTAVPVTFPPHPGPEPARDDDEGGTQR